VRSALAFGSLAACLVYGATPSLAATSSWPRHFTATLITWPAKEHVPKPLAFGTTAVTTLGHGISAPVYVGNTGWMLSTQGPVGDGCTYPIFSDNHGATWNTSGTYLSLSGAAGAFANTLKAFTPKIVVAFSHSNVFDVTWDGGRHWYAAWMPGNIVSVSNTRHANIASPAGVLQVEVASLSRPATYRLYTSTTSGRSWSASTIP
jgi:hypothetical protein